MRWTARQVAEMVDGELVGDPAVPVASMEALDRAGGDQLTFIGDAKYAACWPRSGAGAALVARGIRVEPGEGRTLIFVDEVDLAVAKVLEAMAPPPPRPDEGIHPSAVVDPSAKIGDGVRIGPLCSIGPETVIGDGAALHSSVTILGGCRIGADCVLWPGVVIRERCRLGDRCIVHPNATIGADGFGYRPAPDNGKLIKIPQIGTVEIGSDVEIGAGTCVDRGKFAATRIGDGTKIDNLVQIAHNCVIGRNVLIAGCVGIAGSVTVGDGAMFGGCAVIRDHVTIGPGARVLGFAGVIHDVPPGDTWGGYVAKDSKAAMREHLAMNQLPDLVRDMKKQKNPNKDGRGGG